MNSSNNKTAGSSSTGRMSGSGGDTSSKVKRPSVPCRLCPNRINGPVPPWDDAGMQEFIQKFCKNVYPNGCSNGGFSFCHECYSIMLRLWELRETLERFIIQVDETLDLAEEREQLNQPGSSDKRLKIQPQRNKLKNLLLDVYNDKLTKRKEENPSFSFPNDEVQAGASLVDCSADDFVLRDKYEGQEAIPDPVPVDEQFILLSEIKQELSVEPELNDDGDWMEVDQPVLGDMVQLMDVKEEVVEPDPNDNFDDAEMTDNEDVGGLPIYVFNREKRKGMRFEGVQIHRMFGIGAHSEMEFLQCGACDYNTPLPIPYNKKASPFMAIKTHILHDHKKEPCLPKKRRATEPICVLCFSKFGSLKELKEHRSTHPPDANPECDICKKPFRRGTGLSGILNHKFSHKNDEEREAAIAAGEQGTHNNKLFRKSFAKTTCGESAGKRRRNRAKGKSIARTNGSYSMPCSVCGRCFNRQSSLTNHLKTHGVFQSTTDQRKRLRKSTTMKKGTRKSSRRTSKANELDIALLQEAPLDLTLLATLP